MVIFGTSRSLLSSVTLHTTTAILSLQLHKPLDQYFDYTYCPFKSWATFEIEIGGLLILEEMSLLNTVLLNELSVLLDKNLNSYKQEKNALNLGIASTYFDKKMLIKICASCILFVRVLNSTSFDEINTLNDS